MLYEIKSLRKIVLPLLKKFSKDITIAHHWTGDKVFLNSYLHKGYWYHGKNREKETFNFFEKIINKGNTVIEVGGHIGYLTLFFSKLVTESGKVHVFEPGENNIKYIQKNVAAQKNIKLSLKAVGDKNGIETFYMDNITGQNNSMLKDFEGLSINMNYAMDKNAKTTEVNVEVITLDDYCTSENIKPDFIKIDVEGFEYNVLLGMKNVIHSHPHIMIEVQKYHEEIYNFFEQNGYLMYTENQEKIDKNFLLKSGTQNFFCIHSSKLEALKLN